MALFVEMVAAGGVRAAARANVGSRSHLSRRLLGLEERIGAKLVERDESRFVLTEAGVAYLARAEAILVEVRAAEDAAKASAERVRGSLCVATSPLLAEVVLEQLVQEYLSLHPQVSVDLQLAPERVDLRAKGVDLAFRTGRPPTQAGLTARTLATSLTVMVASERYVATHGVPHTPDALGKHDCVVVGNVKEWQLRTARARVRDRYRVNSYAPAKRAVLAGVGIGRFAAVFVADEIESGRLQLVLPEESTSATVYAVRRGTGRAGPKVRAFLDLAITRITTGLLCPVGLRRYLPADRVAR